MSTKFTVSTTSTQRKAIAFFFGLALAGLALLLLPATALAIPGSGSFTSLHTPGGRSITELYNLLAWICLVILIIVEGILFVAIFKFRRRSDDERPKPIHGHLPLEITWTLAALVLQIYIAVVTIQVMLDVEVAPETEFTVEAIAYQWGWQFRYPDHGGLTSDDLVVPAHTNIKLAVTSRDVLHAIMIPELGIKLDTVPGRFNHWWFRADGPINQVRIDERRIETDQARLRTTRPDFVGTLYEVLGLRNRREGDIRGLEQRVTYLAQSRPVGDVSPYEKYDAVEYRGMCAELCGRGHYDMYFRTVAMTRSSFEQWLEDQRMGSGEVDGGAVYQQLCASCHGADGQGVTGFPPLVNVPWTVEEDMKDEHIRVVLLGSDAPSLQGPTEILGVTYTSVMQAWNEMLNDAEVAAVVNHERTSWGNDGGEVTAEDVARVREEEGLPPFPAGGAEPIPESELLAEGRRVYQSCVACHGDDGRGLARVPNLAQSPRVLADPRNLVDILVNGQDRPEWPGAKTPMGRTMSDYQLSAVLSYIRRSWDNDASLVMPDEVERLRREVRQ